MEIFFGYLGVLLLSTSGIPQFVKIMRTKNVSGLSPYSLIWVCSGCCCMLSYVLMSRGFSILAISYMTNAVVSCTNLTLYLIYKK